MSSTHVIFPTGIVVCKFTFPLWSVIVPASITIFVSPLKFAKFPNVNVYPTATSSAFAFCRSALAISVCSSVSSVISTKFFVIPVCSTLSTYTFIFAVVSELLA